MATAQASTEDSLAFAPKGSLKRVPFPRLIREIAKAELSGSLYLLSQQTKKVVFFEDGQPVFVRSNVLSECLGQVLAHEGLITQEQCEQTLEAIRRTGKKQGELLVEMGILSEGNLRYGLEAQLRAKLFDIFSWEDGRYQFKRDTPNLQFGIKLEASPEGVIVEAIQDQYAEDRARNLLAPVVSKYPVALPDAAQSHALGLLVEEEHFVACLDGSRTVAEVLEGPHEPVIPSAAALLYGLVAAGVVQLGDKAMSARAHPASPDLSPGDKSDEELVPKFEARDVVTEYEDTPLPGELPKSPDLLGDHEDGFAGVEDSGLNQLREVSQDLPLAEAEVVDETFDDSQIELLEDDDLAEDIGEDLAPDDAARQDGGAQAPKAEAPPPEAAAAEPSPPPSVAATPEDGVAARPKPRTQTAPNPALAEPAAAPGVPGPMPSPGEPKTPEPVAPAPITPPAAAAAGTPAAIEDAISLGSLEPIEESSVAPSAPSEVATLTSQDVDLDLEAIAPDDDLLMGGNGRDTSGDLEGDLAIDPEVDIDLGGGLEGDDLADLDDIALGEEDFGDLGLAEPEAGAPQGAYGAAPAAAPKPAAPSAPSGNDDLLDFDDLDAVDLGGLDDGPDLDTVGIEPEPEPMSIDPVSIDPVSIDAVPIEEDASESPEVKGAKRFNEAETALADGRFADAVGLLEEAYDNGFDVAELHAMLAYARFMASGQDRATADHAFELLDYAQNMDPSLDLVHAYRGAIYRATGEPDRAREALDRALELNPYCELAMEIMDSLG